MATMLREGCVREQSILVELQEHFDVLSADMRMENEITMFMILIWRPNSIVTCGDTWMCGR